MQSLGAITPDRNTDPDPTERNAGVDINVLRTGFPRLHPFLQTAVIDCQ